MDGCGDGPQSPQSPLRRYEDEIADPLKMEDMLGSAVLLADEDASLSSQIITDYFTTDGPQAGRRLQPAEDAPEMSILEESSGDEEVRSPRKQLSEGNSQMPVEIAEEKTTAVLDHVLDWVILLSVVVMMLSIARYIWKQSDLAFAALNMEL
ncbi:hypothetical protein BBJ28_00022088 [Nothophytophthora sp. Chile5]|nr:hypothetical protein BBJ28_00022088 [Nothophytophthora sp. Chile5]